MLIISLLTVLEMKVLTFITMFFAKNSLKRRRRTEFSFLPLCLQGGAVPPSAAPLLTHYVEPWLEVKELTFLRMYDVSPFTFMSL